MNLTREALLAAIDVSLPGLEIGPLNRPVVTRDMGPVEYIDRSSRAELQAWYAGPEVDPEQIVEIDHVWGDQTLLDCVGGRRAYGYVLASHVIEHVPDLFGWLAEIAAVLVDGGIAAFVVPDKRYTFDAPRRTSAPAEMLDAYVRRLRRPDPRQVFDHFYHFREPGQTEGRDPAELLDTCRRAYADGTYIDSHCWVFTPQSLAEAMDFGSRLGVLPFEIAALQPTPPGDMEFVVALRRLPDGLSAEVGRAAFLASLEQVLPLPPEATPEPAEPPPPPPPPPPEETVDDEAPLREALARAAALESSTSWRIMAPLRAAATLLRRLTG